MRILSKKDNTILYNCIIILFISPTVNRYGEQISINYVKKCETFRDDGKKRPKEKTGRQSAALFNISVYHARSRIQHGRAVLPCCKFGLLAEVFQHAVQHTAGSLIYPAVGDDLLVFLN